MGMSSTRHTSQQFITFVESHLCFVSTGPCHFRCSLDHHWLNSLKKRKPDLKRDVRTPWVTQFKTQNCSLQNTEAAAQLCSASAPGSSSAPGASALPPGMLTDASVVTRLSSSVPN